MKSPLVNCFLSFIKVSMCMIGLSNQIANAGTLIKSVILIDSGMTSEPSDILIEGSRIAQISRHTIESAQHDVYDATGLYAIPGLIDSHTHLASVPGAALRQDSLQEIAKQQRLQLASYLAAGVTTVLDCAIGYPSYLALKRYVDQTGLGPRVLVLGPVVMPTGGYFGTAASRSSGFDDLWLPVDTDAEIRDRILSSIDLPTLGIKLTTDDGFGPLAKYKVYSAAQRHLISELAHEHNLKIFIHSYSENEHRKALEMQPYALVHSGYNEGKPSPHLLKNLANSSVYVMTTGAISDLIELLWDPERIEREGLQYLVPKKQLETLKDPRAIAFVSRNMVVENAPSYFPKALLNKIKYLFFNRRKIQSIWRSSHEAIRLMHESGVQLVTGSDSGNWPVLVSLFHGYGTIREIDLLFDAGIPPAEVLEMSGIRNARLLGMENEIGSISVGKVADIVLLAENPLQSKRALHSIKAVIKNGRIKPPRQWIKEAELLNR